MTKEQKITLKLTNSEAYSVMQVLHDAQVGYSTGDTTPERVIKLREVIASLEKAVEDFIDAEQ